MVLSWFSRVVSHFSWTEKTVGRGRRRRTIRKWVPWPLMDRFLWARPRLVPLEDRVTPALFTVTTTADSGAGSLRQAILDANAAAGADTIDFAIGTGAVTIAPLSALPTITDPVVIDGTTQPGWTSSPIVELRGDSAGSAHGFDISTGSSTIRGFVINRFSGIGIRISGASATGNTVAGNYIGTDVTGTADLGNSDDGVRIENYASNNTIGGSTAGARNVISGNNNNGIQIYGASVSGNTVSGNFIGTNAAGTAKIANSFRGIWVVSGPTNTTIGGLTTTPGTGLGNVISGNGLQGVVLQGSASNFVLGNVIGLDATGSTAVANAAGGVYSDSANNTIGGTAAGSANVISGNSGAGVRLTGSGATGNTVLGNFIGTDLSGTLAKGNTVGVQIESSATGNTIGGTTAAARNVISGNTGNGVYVENSAGNTVRGNYIGTKADGAAALGNSGDGVQVFLSDNTVVRDNVLSGNVNGLTISGGTTTGCVVTGNIIGLNADGVASVPNSVNGIWLVYADGNTIGGTNATDRNIISGNLAHGIHVQSGANTNQILGNYIGTNKSGTADLGNAMDGIRITGGAFNTVGSLSGAANLISGNGDYGVNLAIGSNDNTVIGNLIGTNAAGTAAIGNKDGGVSIQGSRNTIGGTTAAARNIISGSTDIYESIGGAGVVIYDAGWMEVKDNVVQGNYIGTNASGLAALGNALNGVSIALSLSGNTGNLIGGTAAGAGNIISGNSGPVGYAGSAGLYLAGFGTTVQGNWIGLASDGTALPNIGHGIRLYNQADGNLIGGTAAGAGNVISGNSMNGIYLGSGNGSHNSNTIQGNFIGTNAAGTAAVPNTGAGIVIEVGTGNIIGGPVAGAANVISGNLNSGVVLTGSTASENAVLGNFIGTNFDGSAKIANSGHGVHITSGASRNYIGSTPHDFYVTSEDTNNFIRTSGITGALEYVVPNSDGSLTNPRGIAVGPDGNLYVSSRSTSNSILRFDRTTGAFIDAFVSSGSGGLVNPHGLSFGPDGHLYVAASGNVIKKYNGTTGAYIGDFVASGSGGLTSPRGLTFGADGHLYVSSGNIIKRFNGTTGAYISDFVTSGSGGLNAAFDLKFGPDGSLYVASFGTNQVLKYNGVSGAFIGVFASGSGLVNPHGLSFGPDGHLYVSNDPSNSVLRFNGVTGAFIDTFVAPSLGGITFAAYNTFAQSAIAGNIISGNSGYGIQIDSGGNVVQGNRIGTNATGTASIANTDGIGVFGSGNRIGTDGNNVNDTAERNVISGNTGYGVLIQGGSTNTVAGNYIGVNAAGDAAVPNNIGVATFYTSGNTIGTDGSNDAFNANERNVISGNKNRGVILEGANVVAGNYIGVNAAGTAAIGNEMGVQVTEVGSRVGTNSDGIADAEERNVISGNYLDGGIRVGGATTKDAIIAGNYIGTNAAGTAAIPNSIGVDVRSGANNITVGGSTTATRNVISGNTNYGVQLTDSNTTNNYLFGNYIGTSASGMEAVPNYVGVLVTSNANDNWIGTDGNGLGDATEGNLISGNTNCGIITGAYGPTANTVIAGNIIGLASDGVTRLNNLIGIVVSDWSVDTRVGTDGDGTSDALERNVISGNFYEGMVIEGSNTQRTWVSGNFIGTNVAGSATAYNGNHGIAVRWGAQNTIIGTDESGDVNDASERNLISGNANFGIVVHTPQWDNSLPPGGIQTDGTVIAGNWIGLNDTGGALGNGWGGIIVQIGATNTVIGGLTAASRNIISGNTGVGITVTDTGTTGTTILGNYIGTNAAGTAALGNTSSGISIQSGATNTTVGGTTASARNVIAGHAVLPGFPGDGISVGGSTTTGTVIQGNFIGLGADGSTALGNGWAGIRLYGAPNTIVGGLTATPGSGGGNVISGNTNFGIYIDQSTATGNVIQGNLIGTDASGTLDRGNPANGIFIGFSASNNTVGGGVFGSRNVISGNDTQGIAVSGAGVNGNVIAGNIIGLNITGTAVLPNTSQGILVAAGAVGTRIGTDGDGTNDANEGNIVSGNNSHGLRIVDAGTNSTIVAGNWIGTDITGTQDFGNAASGILIRLGAANTRIGTNGDGTSDAAELNLISGNNEDGIQIRDIGTTGTIVAGNFIGTNKGGTGAIGNSRYGVNLFSGAAGNLIGTNADGNQDVAERNIISGNVSHGVYVQGILVQTLATVDSLIDGTTPRTTATGTIVQADFNDVAGPVGGIGRSIMPFPAKAAMSTPSRPPVRSMSLRPAIIPLPSAATTAGVCGSTGSMSSSTIPRTALHGISEALIWPRAHIRLSGSASSISMWRDSNCPSPWGPGRPRRSLKRTAGVSSDRPLRIRKSP